MRAPVRLLRSSDPEQRKEGIQRIWATCGYGIRNWRSLNEHRKMRRMARKLAKRKERIEAGLCRDCGKPNNTCHTRCQECYAKHGSLRKYRKEAGLCTQCGGPRGEKIGSSLYCRDCYRKAVKYSALKRPPDAPPRLCPDCKTNMCPPRKHHCLQCWEKRRVASQKKAQNTKRAYKAKVYAAYGNKCAHCGENREAVLQIDHVNNDGNKEPRTPKGKRRSVPYYRICREGFPPRYQILCITCNLRKYGETLLIQKT